MSDINYGGYESNKITNSNAVIIENNISFKNELNYYDEEISSNNNAVRIVNNIIAQKTNEYKSSYAKALNETMSTLSKMINEAIHEKSVSINDYTTYKANMNNSISNIDISLRKTISVVETIKTIPSTVESIDNKLENFYSNCKNEIDYVSNNIKILNFKTIEYIETINVMYVFKVYLDQFIIKKVEEAGEELSITYSQIYSINIYNEVKSNIYNVEYFDISDIIFN